jgi:C4-dicarboxylate-specific signal transduction histidine kinase
MNDVLGRIGLEFYGKVTASISHELNNRLAVINEQAGLLEDHVQLSQQGRELDLERLKKLAATVQKQVAQANKIIKNMNRFAHSADQPNQQLDLNEVLELAVALSQRTADMREVSIEVQRPDEPLMMVTSFFRLLNLLWLGLIAAIEITAPKGAVTVILDKNATKKVLLIRTDMVAGGKINEDLAATAGKLAADIGLGVEVDSVAGNIVVNFE